MGDNDLPSKVLLIDQDKSIANGLKRPFDQAKIKLDAATDLGTALYVFNQNIYPVILIDIDFSELPALVLVQRWRSHDNLDKKCSGLVLLLGNRRALEPAEKKLIDELEDIEVLVKPIVPPKLLALLQKSFQKRNQRLKYAELVRQARTLASKAETLPEAKVFVQTQLKHLGAKGYDLLRELYEQTQEITQALDAVEGWLKAAPKNLSALNHKGRLLLKLGKIQDALKIMEEADKEAPQNIDRINDMASAYLLAKNPDKAVEKMREMIHLHKDQTELKFEMFSKLYEHGFDDHAIHLCKETSDPREVVRHYNNLGVALAKGDQVDRAITEYERALRYFPKSKENYKIFFNLALSHITYKNSDHYLLARDYLKKSLELKGDFDKAQRTLESVEDQLKKWKKTAS